MKSFRMLVLIAVVALFQVNTFANDGNPVEDKSKVFIKTGNADKTLSLRLVNLQKIATAISLQNEEGETLFDRDVKNEVGTSLKLNFSQLKAGEYKLFIERAQKSYVQALSIENNTLIVGEMVEIYKPVIKKTKVGFIVTTQGKDVKEVSLLDEYGDVVYRKSYNGNDASSYRFSMKEVPSGEYTIKVKTAYDAYFKTIVTK